MYQINYHLEDGSVRTETVDSWSRAMPAAGWPVVEHVVRTEIFNDGVKL